MNILDQLDLGGYRFWKADPHEYGPGKLHAVGDGDTSVCGENLDIMGGRFVGSARIDCKRCLRSYLSHAHSDF